MNRKEFESKMSIKLSTNKFTEPKESQAELSDPQIYKPQKEPRMLNPKKI